jgi:hypothetical protein
MMKDNERWIIELGFGEKKIKHINYYYLGRVEPQIEPTPTQLNSFNYRTRLAPTRFEPELSHESEFFYAALLLLYLYIEKAEKGVGYIDH